MALDPVVKVEITAHNATLDLLMEELQSSAIVQIDAHRIKEWESEKRRLDEAEKGLAGLREELLAAQRAHSFLEKHAPRVSILQKFSHGPDFKTRKELESYYRDDESRALIERAHSLERTITDIDAGSAELTSMRRELEPIRGLSVSLSLVGEGRVTRSFVARLERETFERFADGAKGDLVHVETIEDPSRNARESDDEVIYFLCAYHGDAQEEIDELLKEYRVEPIAMPDEDSTPSQLVGEHEKGLRRFEEERASLVEESAGAAAEIRRLKYYVDYLETEIEKETAKQDLFFTERASVIQGWVKERDLDRLRAIVARHETADVKQIEREEEEIPPVSYRNNALVSPFEIIVNLYSPPNHREVDPTPILMPFYAIFFGVCLTEAGYGLVIAVISLVAMSLIRANNGMKRFMKLFFILGCATFVIGTLMGTVFGINFNLLPDRLAWMREARNRVLLFDSSNNIMGFFALSLALGVLHLVTGYIIKMYMLFRDGEWAEAVCDHLPWVIILLSPTPIALKQFGAPIENPMRVMLVLIVFAGAIMLFFSERGSWNPVKRIGKGIFTIYGITGVMADVLSYSRLLALGLATGVIAGVVNTLAGMVKEIPVVGIVGFVGVIIGGHLFNLFISGLSAFVHSIRLQFMEFFTKFYTGEGELLTAFAEKRRYTHGVAERD
jgi:V/A-type H+-transporting ATPase subunit I